MFPHAIIRGLDEIHTDEDGELIMSSDDFVLALGVLVGNWLVVPMFFSNRTFTDGFFIGCIAAALVLLLRAALQK